MSEYTIKVYCTFDELKEKLFGEGAKGLLSDTDEEVFIPASKLRVVDAEIQDEYQTFEMTVEIDE